MNTIICPHCKKPVEISEALRSEFEEQNLKKWEEEKKVEIEKIKMTAFSDSQKKLQEQFDLQMKQMLLDAKDKEKQNKELYERLEKLMEEGRVLKREKDEMGLEMQKKLAGEEEKIRLDAKQKAEEEQHLKIAEKDKQLRDTLKELEDARRKLTQGSQQAQGETFEVELEKQLKRYWPQDSIEPIAKGISGADIKQTVKTTLGTNCGVILWELKRTKSWSNDWVPKLKKDVLNEKANAAVIVSTQLPEEAKNGFGQINGVYICSPDLFIPISGIVRKNLIDVARQINMADKRGDKASELYNYVTSHEFPLQVENIIEAYREISLQIDKERTAMERIWKVREAQAQRIIISTANIVGSIQGKVGSSMPQIKGLDLLEDGK